MKEQTAVEWYAEQAMLLEIKVTEILGFDKTVELLKQCNDEII